MAHTEKPDDCACCGWETVELEECDAYARTEGHGPFTPDSQKQWAWLCNVCRSTQGGNTFLYPTNYPGDTWVVIQTLNWGINAILDEIVNSRG